MIGLSRTLGIECMLKTLALFAHPFPRHSKVNRLIFESIQRIPKLTAHSIYENYPDFYIDVKKEQSLLLAHDLIFVQSPFYWYNLPALMKEWADRVLEIGFAYGEGGTFLRGKYFQISITAGWSLEAYHSENFKQFSIEELLRPWEQTAYHCGMKWLPPLVLHSARLKTSAEIELHSQNVTERLLSVCRGQDSEGRG